MFRVIKNVAQGTDEWLKLRRKHITATDCGKILQEVPLSWGTPYSLWLDKIIGRQIEPNKRMLRGMYLEPHARKEYCTQKQEDYDPLILISDEHPWMMASLDGINKSLTHCVEFKCGESAHQAALEGKIKDYYIPQLQHILALTGHKTIDYATYWNDELIVLEHKRDEEYIENLLVKEKEFYECLVNTVEPKNSLDYYEEIDNIEAQFLMFNLNEALKKKKELEKIILDYKKQLIEIADGRNVRINETKIRKVLKKGSIDYSKIDEIQDMDLEPYRKEPIEYYKFI